MTLQLPPPKSVRALAKADGVDLSRLLRILQVQRPDKSEEEKRFCAALLEHLPTERREIDDYGNIILRIGESTTMFSCHTDTVASKGGYQNVEWHDNLLRLNKGKPGQCLGADDGAGIWLMLEMIDAKKPGLYIFHRAEEVGGLGSSFLVKNTPDIVEGIQRAIAFDRKGMDSVITRQRGSRCCSDIFARALADSLNEQDPSFTYSPDSTGVFTDTANYDELIPECTNLSVGYEKQHGPLESLDVMHLYKMREALLATDFEALPTERDPTEVDSDYSSSYGGYYGGGYGSWGSTGGSRTGDKAWDYPETLVDVIVRRKYALSKWLGESGWTADNLNDALDALIKAENEAWEQDEEFMTTLWCNDCCDEWTAEEAGYTPDIEFEGGEDCPNCLGRDTEPREYEYAPDHDDDDLELPVVTPNAGTGLQIVVNDAGKVKVAV